MPRHCKFDGCTKRPSFNFVGNRVPVYCVTHSLLNMVDVSSKCCKHEGCRTHPSFNYPIPGNKVGLYCCAHRLEGMIDVRSRKCIHESGCTTFPTFNFEGEKPGRYCSSHKLPGMIDVRQSTKTVCRFEGCEDPPTCNFPDKKGARFCDVHKLDGMVSKIVKCEEPDCHRQPTLGYEGYSATYCVEHGLEGMTCVSKSKRHCVHQGCSTYPSFNYEGAKGKRYCAAHKLEGMIEIKRRLCEAEGCSLHASFNYAHLKKRRFCASHSEPGMVPVSRSKAKAKRTNDTSVASTTDALIACLATLHKGKRESTKLKRKLADVASAEETLVSSNEMLCPEKEGMSAISNESI